MKNIYIVNPDCADCLVNIRNAVFETNSSSVHSVTYSNVGLKPSELPMDDDGYVIAYYGEFGKDLKYFKSQSSKLSYLVSCCYYLGGWNDPTESSYQFRQIEDVVKEYIPGCQGIKIADFPDQPDIDHQSIPEYDIEIVNIYDEEELINFIFNENVYLKTTCD